MGQGGGAMTEGADDASEGGDGVAGSSWEGSSKRSQSAPKASSGRGGARWPVWTGGEVELRLMFDRGRGESTESFGREAV